MNGGEWHSVNRYDEATKQDQNIACVGFDPRTGEGFADARLIAAAPALVEALEAAIKAIASMGGDLEVAAPDSINANSYGDELRRLRAALSLAKGTQGETK